MLVGQVILSARRIIPDLPPTLAAPSMSGMTATGSGGTLPTATYYSKVTALNDFGESLASSESAAVPVTLGQTLQVTFGTIRGATKYRVYIGTATGTQDQFAEGTVSPIIVSALGTAAKIPTRSTAYLPDNDGDFMDVFQTYDWLNDGLDLLARIAGGILDTTGVRTLIGQGAYELPTQWVKITNVWHDGYPVALGARADAFYRDKVSSTISNVLLVDKFNDKTVIELWPQPSSSGLSTTTTGSMTATSTSVALTSVTGLLPMGLIQIENEVMLYSAISGLTLTGLIRGMGGSVAVAHNSAVTATELNLRLVGYRFPSRYAVGDSAKTLAVPPAWESMLTDYIVHRFRLAEQQFGEAQQLLQRVERDINMWLKANKPIAGPRQVGGDTFSNERVGGGLGGGWIRT